MAHAGAVTTRESIELSEFAEKTSAACLSVITPYFINPNQSELFEHYRAICQSVTIPVLAYNNPDRTGGLSAPIYESFQAFQAGDYEKALQYQRQLTPIRAAFGLG